MQRWMCTSLEERGVARTDQGSGGGRVGVMTVRPAQRRRKAGREVGWRPWVNAWRWMDGYHAIITATWRERAKDRERDRESEKER